MLTNVYRYNHPPCEFVNQPPLVYPALEVATVTAGHGKCGWQVVYEDGSVKYWMERKLRNASNTITTTYTFDPVTLACTSVSENVFEENAETGEFFTNEYTTAMLLEDSALPDFPETPDYVSTDGGDIAWKLLGGSGGDSSISRGKGKYRFRFSPTPSGYLKIWVKIHFTPTTGSPTDTVSTFTWEGTPTDPSLSYDHEDNDIVLAGGDVEEPASYGTTTISIEKYSYLSGYEPSDKDAGTGIPIDPQQPDGFPNFPVDWPE